MPNTWTTNEKHAAEGRLFRIFVTWVIGLALALLLPGLCIIILPWLKNMGWIIVGKTLPTWALISFGGATLVSVILSLLLTKKLSSACLKGLSRAEKRLASMAPNELGFWMIGLVAGLLVAYLLSGLTRQIPSGFQIAVNILIYLLSVRLFLRVFSFRKESLIDFFKRDHKVPISKKTPKVLDISAIIDGRIFDILQTGFVDGPLTLPSFVLAHLRKLAEDEDANIRARGKHGLDVLSECQKQTPNAILVQDISLQNDVNEDTLSFAKSLSAHLITADSQLAQLATVQGVTTLCVNDLAGALKTVTLPGETLEVQIMREGKEPGQGVGYLEDGTMIVIEGGREWMGQSVVVVTTGTMQTSAGRLVFARLEGAKP